MSWMARSIVTPTSMTLEGNGLSLWQWALYILPSSFFSILFFNSIITGLNLSMWPIITLIFFSSDFFIISDASASFAAIGFSMSVGIFLLIVSIETSLWYFVGTQTETASIFSESNIFFVV